MSQARYLGPKFPRRVLIECTWTQQKRSASSITKSTKLERQELWLITDVIITDDNGLYAKWDHTWVLGCKKLKNLNMGRISFTSGIHEYKKKNKTTNIGLKFPYRDFKYLQS